MSDSFQEVPQLKALDRGGEILCKILMPKLRKKLLNRNAFGTIEFGFIFEHIHICIYSKHIREDKSMADMKKISDEMMENVVGGTLTKEEALSKALQHVNLKKDQVDLVKKVELDYEHGRKVYEVEFYKGGVEYEFDIDAETGAILDFEKDRD